MSKISKTGNVLKCNFKFRKFSNLFEIFLGWVGIQFVNSIELTLIRYYFLEKKMIPHIENTTYELLGYAC